MFEGLKKKLSEAIKGFSKKEEKIEEKVELKEAEQAAEQASEEAVIKEEVKEVRKEEEKKAEKQTPEPKREEAKAEKKEEAKAPEVKISLKTKIKSAFTSTVTLGEKEIDDFAENLKMSMLQSDVSFDTAEDFTNDLRSNLKSAKIDAKDIRRALVEEVRKALYDTLNRAKSGIDVDSFVKERVSKGELPVKILFLGPNGTGKTTTMAKLAHHFKKQGISSVFSASDTFRAAAIEQTEIHANRVGVPIIKSKYGADPASIAFDAIAYAKAHNIQAVLIDSAGRQETNKNLINEMTKMVRVAKPDLIIFVGESTAGNALTNQIVEFNKFMKIDGIILTKLDTDAKGGNVISIAHTTGIPVLYLGTGESYDALVPYTHDFIVSALLPNN